jgi:hypothetical protein
MNDYQLRYFFLNYSFLIVHCSLLYYFFHFSGAETSGADMHPSRTVRSLNFHLLKVRHKHALRPVIGMADIVARNLFLPANCTY